MKGFWKILKNYIWQYRFNAMVFLIFVCIFAGIFILYDLQTEAVIYAGSLCTVIAVIILSINFYSFYKKHQQLQDIQAHVILLLDELPLPENEIEQDYQEIIKELRGIRSEEVAQWKSERRESIDFYTTWVHQIKAPIGAMRLLLQNEDTDENRELLSELFRIEQYTEMVLSYFRLESTSSDFVFQCYPLDDIIRSVIRKFASQFVRKGIKIKYEGTNIVVLTDEKWLTFLLEQIMSNAIKYTAEGCITISVDENEVLSIQDTGIGIASEDLPRIFDKGFTGYNGRRDKKATGLGLYLCKRTADQLSHDLQVESEVGKGTVFHLSLRREELDIRE